jgi:4-hydroxybenzoyl-CoA thioesterase
MSDTPSAPTSRTHVYEVKIQFGDCDPAGIVFFPNYSRWMDEASLAFFMACGIPPWRELVKTRGIVGTPLLEIQTQFKRPSTYGETLQIHTTVEEWNAKTFRHRHIVKRGEDLICEGTEVRAFVIHDPDSGRLKAIPIPEDIRQACQVPAGPTAA